MKRCSSILTSLLVALCLDSARADVHMPAIFGYHMVLQQAIALPVCGKADPGEKVPVTVGSSARSATAGANSKWRGISLH